MIGLFQGSFDPITKGHIDIIKRASKLFDKLYVLVAINSEKKYMFTVDERVSMIEECVKNIDNVIVDSYDGYTADYAMSHDVDTFIRGIRDEKDFLYEKVAETFNKERAKDIETIYMACSEEYKDVSSSKVKELIDGGKDISRYVDDSVLSMIEMKKEG